jgi:hypothetical protein
MPEAVVHKRDPCNRFALTVAELAKRWGIDPHNVLSFIHAGQLKAFNVAAIRAGLSQSAKERREGKVSRPRWRISLEAIAEFEAARSSRPAARPRRKAGRRNQTEVVQFV